MPIIHMAIEQEVKRS